MPIESRIRRRGAPPKLVTACEPARAPTDRDRPLTPRQRVFLERYLLSFNATRAYLEAFPNASWATADSNAPVLLKDHRIASEIRRRIGSLKAKLRPTQERTLREMAALAYSSAKDLFDSNGALLPIADLPDHVAVAIKRIRTREIKSVQVDGTEHIVGHVHDIELHDKVLPLRLLGAREAAFVERVDVTPGKGFDEMLREARQRAIEGQHEKINE